MKESFQSPKSPHFACTVVMKGYLTSCKAGTAPTPKPGMHTELTEGRDPHKLKHFLLWNVFKASTKTSPAPPRIL